MQAIHTQRVSTKRPAAPGTRADFRLGDLVSTPYNVRKVKRTPDDIRAMAHSIQAHGGVMQNLLLVADMADGQWTGKYGVAGGETRRLGCCFLRDGGIPEAASVFTDDFLVPGLVIDAPEASAISATENIRRTQLHPADEFEAFRELFDQCGSVEHVADFFAVSVGTVERRLRLANASPRLFDLYRAGEMNLDQLMALCLVDDHKRQEAAWKAGETYSHMRNAAQLRRALASGKLNLRESRFARFVGAADYETAGGQVVRDLFSVHADDGYIEDGELLHRLVATKLEAAAVAVRAEGWAWVEVKPDFNHDEQSKYGRCPTRRQTLKPAQAKELRALRDQANEAREAWEKAGEDGTEAGKVAQLEAASEALDAQVEAIEAAMVGVEPSFRSIAGAVVTIDHTGRCEIQRGLVRPQDRKELARGQTAMERGAAAGTANAASGRSAVAEPESTDDISRPFKLRLGAQRTAAMQVTLGRNVPLALASLAFTLVSELLLDDRAPNTLRLATTRARDRLSTLDPTIEASRAHVEMGELVAIWKTRLPEEGVFEWLCALPQGDLLQLIAVCTALTLDSLSEHAFDVKPLDGPAAELADRAGLDMADWWTPSASSYFAHVSKANALAVVTQAVSTEAAAPLASLKKAEMGARAETLLEGRRWLPALLRRA